MKDLTIGIAVRKKWINWFWPFTKWDITIQTDIDEMKLTYRIRKAIDDVIEDIESPKDK